MSAANLPPRGGALVGELETAFGVDGWRYAWAHPETYEWRGGALSVIADDHTGAFTGFVCGVRVVEASNLPALVSPMLGALDAHRADLDELAAMLRARPMDGCR